MLSNLKALGPYMKRHLWRYVLGLASLFIASGSQLLIPWRIQVAVDQIASGRFRLETIALIGLSIIGVALLTVAGRLGWRYWIHGAARRIEGEIRSDLFQHLSRQSPAFFARNTIGDLMARSTNDLMQVRMAASMGLVAAADATVTAVVILVILLTQYSSVALWVLIPLPFVSLVIFGLGRLIGPLFGKVQASFSEMSRQAQEVFSGSRVVKSFHKEAWFTQRFGEASRVYQRRNISLVMTWGMMFPLVTFLSGLTALLLLVFGGRAVIFGGLTLGGFVAVSYYLDQLTWPMIGAGFTVNILQRGSASMGRINDLLQEAPEIVSPPGARTAAPRGAIEIRNLSLTYPGTEQAALRDVSLRAERGEIVGILGRTGAGKTTLVNVLNRMLDPPPGTVFLDGTDVRDYDLATLRTAFGLVAQDQFLFSDTVSANIRFGRPEATEDEVRRMAEISTIHRDITSFPDGYQTVVGERGVTLSGGQKQRVAISRAVITDPEILVMDDSLSAVDTETEERILDHLREVRSDRTTILISHRVSTLSNADRIYVMDDGRIVEQGTHAELVAHGGFYAQTWEHQRLEDAIGAET